MQQHLFSGQNKTKASYVNLNNSYKENKYIKQNDLFLKVAYREVDQHQCNSPPAYKFSKGDHTKFLIHISSFFFWGGGGGERQSSW